MLAQECSYARGFVESCASLALATMHGTKSVLVMLSQNVSLIPVSEQDHDNTMNAPPSLTDPGKQKDKDHIRILAIFHFVLGALNLLGVGFIFLHYFMMRSLFTNPEMWKGKEAQAPPKELFEVFIWLYVLMGIMLVLASAGNALSGVFLLKKKYRMFSLIVAGLDCLFMPFGTLLGVFTIIVLIRDSVRRLYAD
jgi:hypothetical protein